jgi:16S rRNA (uracil1498-N3)-methyltransferase
MGHIQSITRHSSYITLGDVNLSPPPAKKWTLALAWIRPQKIELALEKGTELGIDRFLLFKAKRSERRPPSYERIKTILISALKQSGRLYLPELEIIDKLELPQQAMHEEAVYYGALSPGASPITSPPKNLCFFIGPEGGFTEEELTLFNSATPVGLGPHILRAETAAITAAAQLAQYRL